MKIRTITAITTTVPALDEKGKPLPKAEIEFHGRKIMTEVHDHVRHEANRVVDLPDAIANDLIKRGFAASLDEILDEDGV